MKIEFESKSRFITDITALPFKGEYSQKDLLTERFRLYGDSSVEIYYTPFDYFKPEAKLIFVGITPGWTQMELAYRAFRTGVEIGKDMESICVDIERKASFAGSMRTNLVNMFNELLLPQLLGIRSTASLFAEHHDLVHTTSVIRYATFVHNKNYTGHSPDMLEHPELRKYVEKVLSRELNDVPNALIVPLGQAVSEALRHLVQKERLDSNRCLLDFPHPSGANGHRKKHFEERREAFGDQISVWFRSAANQAL